MLGSNRGRKEDRLPMKLTSKIFVALLVTSFTIVALMLGTLYYYLPERFHEYVNQKTLNNLDELVADLAADHQANQGWGHLRDNRSRWRALLRQALPNRARSAPLPPAPEPGPMGPPAEDHFSRSPEPSGPVDRAGSSFFLLRSLALLDENRNHVAGQSLRGPIDSYTLRPMVVHNRLIGYLALHRREPMDDPMVQAFLNEQALVFTISGAAILIIAALVSLLLSRHLLGPIRRLAQGTRALAAFDFDTVIEVRATDELGQLAADFNRMARTLKQYESMRKQWLSDISHELRTPLAIVKGEIEALQDGVRPYNRPALDSLHTEVGRLGKLVEALHLLSLADSQALRMRSDAIRPFAILRQRVGDFTARLAARQIDIQLLLEDDPPVTITGDADRLAQVFSNLLENSLRYTDSSGTLTIRGGLRDSCCKIRFEDSGPGVPTEALPRLFDRLYRVDQSRSRDLGGSGLGLAICKQIVEAHGGTIGAVHGAAGGLVIEMELPISHSCLMADSA